MYAYIGTMASQDDPARGITVVDLDGPRTRVAGSTAGSATNPMYFATSADQAVLYAAHATADGQVSAWMVRGAVLTQLGPTRHTGGGVACHLSVDPRGRHLLTTNYASGTIAVHTINDDGTLGDASDVIQHPGVGTRGRRQGGSHPHMITADPSDRPGRGHFLAVDLGTDTIYRYRLDTSTGHLDEADLVTLPLGTGPRHLAVHGDYAYVVGELGSTVTVLDLNTSPPTVLTTVLSHATVGAGPCYPSAIRFSPDGRFCYVLNRGPNTVATFTVDGPDLSLIATVDSGGDYPWDATIHDDHLYVVNQRSSTLSVFYVDPRSGVPQITDTSIDVPCPVCILPIGVPSPQALPAGRSEVASTRDGLI
ncbi:lactonase family protein [Phytoactinopolyspora alkaliphila]|uniref:Lactonase family protein n=1 Tax=Phytoactinopolyspora alkaliphila TaxID=1783498 RepID=A0A6N9YS62_9ACTN|nr:lactonase family protein [Phytoactinopolyspora alkaliphila]NED97886.1 lactonase family protein [Phytoactinopolyspora alkaliphila]